MPRSRSIPAPITASRFRSGRSMTRRPPSGIGSGCWRSIAAICRHDRKMPIADITIREYENPDAEDLNRLAVSAFSQFRDQYQDWPAVLAGLSQTSALSATGEVIV